MVWLKNVGMRPVYICDRCGLGYCDAKTALECEGYCSRHKACSREIAEKAVYHPD